MLHLLISGLLCLLFVVVDLLFFSRLGAVCVVFVFDLFVWFVSVVC